MTWLFVIKVLFWWTLLACAVWLTPFLIGGLVSRTRKREDKT